MSVDSNIVIKVSNLSKKFKKEIVFENININIERGQIYGFVGYNGSGKSVFFKILCGLLLPDNGIVKINNKILNKDIDFPENIGVIIEQPGFFREYSGFKNLKYLASIRKKINNNEIIKTMELVGLDPNDKKSVRKYSLGMKQKLAIAQAIMEKPDILILDEPMNALDKKSVKKTRQLFLDLKDAGTTILMTSHISEDIELLCSNIYEFDNKQLKKIK